MEAKGHMDSDGAHECEMVTQAHDLSSLMELTLYKAIFMATTLVDDDEASSYISLIVNLFY
jgi:hypothetical protein